MASIATRTGDDGTTSLLYGQRVSKAHPRIELVGNFDELNAALGLARAWCPVETERARLEDLQKCLVALMGELACHESDLPRYLASNFPKVDESALARVDAAVAAIESAGLRFDGWATPGANPHAAALDLARTIARRAERGLCALAETGANARPVVRQFVNRLSDLLWLLARQAEQPEAKS